MSSKNIADITGSFGCWQKRIFILCFYVGICGMWHNLAITFLAPNMSFHCINSTEQCVVREGNLTSSCTEWEYDTSFYSENMVNKWDLVCDREWLISLAKSIYMIGFLISVLVFGQISDWVGRFPVIVTTYIITVFSMFLSLFSTSYLMFIILRFFQAFGRTGLTTTGYVLLMEIIGEKYRTKIGIGVQAGWAIGFATLAGIAYVFRNWFWLQLIIYIPFLPLAFVYPWIPESPRWLLMRNKLNKLETLLQKAAKINGKEVKFSVKDLQKYQDHSEKSSNSVIDVFKTPRLRRWTICMIYLWMVNAFMYYGLSYNTNDLIGNPYVNCTIAGVLEIPSYVLLFWGIGRLGRRPTLVSLMLVAGISCAAIAVVPDSVSWLSTTLSMIGKFCISASFGLLYLYTTEVFPTVVRNAALGSCSMWARVGSILAPFVRELGQATYIWVPNLVYGLLAISSGLLALLLPETRDKPIPDTLEEGENFHLCSNENAPVNSNSPKTNYFTNK